MVKDIKRYIYLKRIEKLFKDYNYNTSIYQKSLEICSIEKSKTILENNNIKITKHNISLIQNIFSNFVTISLYNCIFNVKLNYSFNFSIFIINNYLDNLFFDNIKRFSLDISKLNTYKELLEKLNNL